MSAKRASTRTASAAAVVATLALGLFAASAVGWYDEEPPPSETTPTETTPTETTPTETTPAVTTPTEPTPEVLPLSPPPVSSGIPAAPPAEAAPVPTLIAPPDEDVKGEAGTREETGSGGANPVVLAQAEDVGVPEAQSNGQLAQTGFDVLILAILGGVALAGSGLLFWRTRTI